MKNLLAGCVFLLLGAAACGSKSDAPAAGSAAGTDPAAASDPNAPGSRSGRIDPNAFRKHHGDDTATPEGASATGGSGGPELPKLGDRMKDLDTDGDGKVSEEERQAGRAKRAADMHAKLDANGDGKLSPEEAEASPMMGRMMKRNPDGVKSLDKNGDGDISADKLAAGMAAMRDHRRNGWGDHRGMPTPPAPAPTGSAQ